MDKYVWFLIAFSVLVVTLALTKPAVEAQAPGTLCCCETLSGGYCCQQVPYYCSTTLPRCDCKA